VDPVGREAIVERLDVGSGWQLEPDMEVLGPLLRGVRRGVDNNIEAGALQNEYLSILMSIVKPRCFSKNAAVAARSVEGKLKWLSFIVLVVSVISVPSVARQSNRVLSLQIM